VVIKDFFWLWGSSDCQGASLVVHPSFSFLGQMWPYSPARRLFVCNQQHQAGFGRSGNGGTLLIGLEVEGEGHLKDFDVIFFVEVFCTV
jgi:hypothetical protein